MKKSKVILLTIVILVLLSAVAQAAESSLSWDDILTKYLGTAENGKLDTSDAIITGQLPRIILACFVAVTGVMLAIGELPSTATTVFRMFFAIAVVSHLGAYFGYMFAVPDVKYVAVAPPDPDVNSGNFIGQFMSYFIYKCQEGAVNIYPICTKIVVLFWAADIVLTLIFKLEDDVIKYITVNSIKMAFFIFLLSNWVTGLGIAHAIYASFEKIGYIAGGGTDTILMPDDIIGNTFKVISTTWDSLSKLSLLDGPFAFFMAIIMFLVVIIAITITAIQIFMTRVEFWVMAVMIMPCIAFGIFKHCRFLLEKAIGGIFNIAIKVGVIAFISAIIAPILTKSVENFANTGFDISKNFMTLFTIVFSTAIIALLVWKVPNLAQALMTGQPSLTGGDMYAPAKAVTSTPANAVLKAAGTMSVASDMPGGKSARGAAGFLAAMKTTGKELGRGNIAGAGSIVKEQASGALGTTKNAIGLGIKSTFLDSYYQAQRIAKGLNQEESGKNIKKETKQNINEKDSPKEYTNAVSYVLPDSKKDNEGKKNMN